MDAPNVVLEQQKRLKALLDKDNSGTVSPAELAEALGKKILIKPVRKEMKRI
ncbi:hypothetical protein [Acetobacterium sp.]|uniref:hypothetical protein n=1 Tax=Acetobacterium sp. TaxID=1872094 RepID=UPI002F40354F